MKRGLLSNVSSSRRADPTYVQISGHVPKTLALDFKLAHIRAQLNQSEALEEALALWVKSKND